jgi:hypothetical protein
MCKVIDFDLDLFDSNKLVLIDFHTGNRKELFTLGAHSRGLKFSPDGKFIAYDAPENNLKDIPRHVYIFAHDELKQIQITAGSSERSDTPIWSPDGKLILYSSLRLGKYDLWALPVKDGHPAGNPFLIHSEMNKTLLSIKNINEDIHSPTQVNYPTTIDSRHTNKKLVGSFDEEFSSPILDPAWQVYEWKSSNVYDYKSFGRYSLSENPGKLRYYLDPIMNFGFLRSYRPYISGFWYWLYPALEIRRPLLGDQWVLETRVTYSMLDGANGRSLILIIFFDPARDLETSLIINRDKDLIKRNSILSIRLFEQGNVVAESQNRVAQDDTLGVTEFTYYYRISRTHTLIMAELSIDGVEYENVLSGQLRSNLKGIPQRLVLAGQSWYIPAGSYADWDYFRFKVLDQ